MTEWHFHTSSYFLHDIMIFLCSRYRHHLVLNRVTWNYLCMLIWIYMVSVRIFYTTPVFLDVKLVPLLRMTVIWCHFQPSGAWPSIPDGHWQARMYIPHSWWRHPMEIFSALLTLCVGNSPVTGEFPAQRPVTRSFDVFFDLHLNKRLSKQPWGWWVETPSHSLWRHCNGYG